MKTKSTRGDLQAKTAAEKLVANDPLRTLAELRKRYAEAAGTFKQRRDTCVVGAYLLARHMEHDRSAMQDFFEGDFFTELRKPEPKKVLLYVMMALVGADTTADDAYENARVYARALQPFFERNAASSDVLASLRRHGITKLYKAAMAQKRSGSETNDQSSRPTMSATDDERAGRSSSDNRDLWSDDDGVDDLARILEIARKCYERRHSWRKDIIMLRVGHDTRNALLSLGSGQTALVMVNATDEESDDGFVDLVAVKQKNCK